MTWDIIRESLRLGAKVSLAAIPYSLVYTHLRMFNFAFGEVITFAAYVVYVLSRNRHWPVWAAVMVAGILSALLGMAIERIAYRRLMETAERHLLLVSSVGVSIVLQNVYAAVFGTRTLYLERAEPHWVSIALLLICELVGLFWLLERTQFGNRVAGVASCRELAELKAIDPRFVYSAVFALASALAVPAGWIELADNGVAPDMGFQLGLLAFAAAVLAGMHSLVWTVVASFGLALLVVAAQATSVLNDRLVWIACLIGAILLAGVRRAIERELRVRAGKDTGT